MLAGATLANWLTLATAKAAREGLPKPRVVQQVYDRLSAIAARQSGEAMDSDDKESDSELASEESD